MKRMNLRSASRPAGRATASVAATLVAAALLGLPSGTAHAADATDSSAAAAPATQPSGSAAPLIASGLEANGAATT